MLRNSYLEKFRKENRKKSEYEKSILKNDGEHMLSLERPLSTISIRKLPKNDFPLFVNDLMCNKETGHLIYPLSFNKQVNLYLKQQSYIYRITTFNKNKNFVEQMKNLKRNREKESERKKNYKILSSPKLSNFKKREEIEEIKANLNSFKTNKNSLMKKLSSKNRKFYKSQPLIDKKLRKLMFRSINDIRIKGYEKAFEDCNNRTMTNKKFNLPDVTLDESNVYSRLYNNIIVKNKTLNFNKSKYYAYKYGFLKKKLNYNFSNSFNYENKIQLSSKSQRERRKINYKDEYHVSNINKNLDGKEFTKKITPKMLTRCLRAISGGPKENREKKYSFYLNNNFYKNKRAQTKIQKKKKFINFHAKLTSKNCFMKMFPDSNNKNNSFSIENKKINDIILANSNSRVDVINIKKFRDSDYNTNLHRSVLKNNIRFVEYFIKKGLDVNKKNKYGNTPLHLAFKIGNKDIIHLLLENGASIKIKNNRGITPFDVAKKDIRDIFNLVDMYNNSLIY